jgi:hypothetical protein
VSLGLATKGILPDFTGTGTGGPGTNIYVLEEFNVEVSHDDVNIAVTQLDEVAIVLSDIDINIDVDLDQVEVISSDDDIIIEV